MSKQRITDNLSIELISLILKYLDPDLDRSVPVHSRRFLSVESFDLPPSTGASTKDIGQFRLVSKDFAELGASLLFTRVSARLSKHGLKRLEQLTAWPHLCKVVKKFTYLVPLFCKHEGILSKRLLKLLEARFGSDSVARYQTKSQELNQILSTNEDLRVLKSVIAKFTALQHVQLLRVQDDEDYTLMTHLQQSNSISWSFACSHGSQTLGAALLASKNETWSRFSSPMLSPQSAEFLNLNRPPSMSILAERLTCLTLHFDDGTDLDQKMSDLSGLFHTVFNAAQDMQAVHVGFPSHRPINLPLEAVFHNVTWKRLTAFGVQGWKLDTQSILNFAHRHPGLKGLRLRDVLLVEGSRWIDVLEGLKETMSLDWVSLRRIDYVKHFESQQAHVGVEVRDDFESESEDEIDVEPSIQREESFDSDSDDEHGPAAHDMELPSLDYMVASRTHLGTDTTAADDLVDDGVHISNTKRKIWEQWLVCRCHTNDDG